MLRLRVTVDVRALHDSEPCWLIRERARDGSVSDTNVAWDGFNTTWGATYVRAADGHAWIDYDGELEHFQRHGLLVSAISNETEHVGWNFLPKGNLARVRESGVAVGAVNKARVLNALTPACTMYRWSDGWQQALVPEIRFDGVVTSVTVPNPREQRLVDNQDPLLAWIEGSKVTI